MEHISTENGLLARLNSLRKTGDLIDFTIVCGSRKWPVHRTVLATHSKVMLKMCGGDFKEAHEGKLDFSDHSPDVIDRMVTYMYTLDYDSDDPEGSCNLMDGQVYILADMYDISGLRELSLKKFRAYAAGWDLSFVKQHSSCLSTAIRLAYDGGATEISDIFVEKLLDMHAFSESVQKIFLELAGGIPDFARDVIVLQAKQLAPPRTGSYGQKRYKCVNCEREFSVYMKDNEWYKCPGCFDYWKTATWAHSVVTD